jgi:tetratricopeptide (TPR) repeat protein
MNGVERCTMTTLRPLSAAFLLATLMLLAAGLPAALEAQPGRISITVTDPAGEPIADVNVSVTTPERGDVKVETVTNKKGKAMVMVPNVALRYDLALARDGYATLTTDVKAQLGETVFKEYQLAPTGGAATSGAAAGTAEERVFTPAELAFNDGVSALAKDDVDTALAKFLEARDKDPGLTVVHSALAAIYLEKKQPQEALAAAQRYLEADPGSPRGLRLVYEAQKQLGNNAEAEKALRELQSKKGDEVAVLLFNEGAEAVKVGDLDNAERRFVEALTAKPDLHQAIDALMIVYARKNDWANAAAQAEKVLANDPASLRALRIRHEAYAKLGDTEKAKQALEALAKADPTALIGSFFDAGVAKFNANDAQGAIADFTEVVELDADHATAHYYLGLCYTSTSKPDLAKTHLERFVALAPNDANAASAREMLKYLK